MSKQKKKSQLKKTKLFEWQEKAKQGGMCGRCNRHFEILTVQHRIPQSLLQQLGLIDEIYEWEENYVLFCKPCNAFQANRIDRIDGVSPALFMEVAKKIQ